MLVNRYKASPVYKSLIKDAVYLLRFAYLYVVNGLRVRTILFYPEFPVFKTEINKVLMGSRFNVTNNPNQPFDLVVCWQDETFRKPLHHLAKLAGRAPVINRYCTDISKRKVDRVFHKIFGYALDVNPRQHRGECVRKSNINATHDACVINCPVEAEDNAYVYQKLLDNSFDDDTAFDLRLPIYGNTIPFVYVRYRPLSKRFYGDFKVEVRDPAVYFSADEIIKILAFCREMGLDYGDLDTVRDRSDGRLYIVDVNNTPQSADADVSMTRADKKRARTLAKRAFLANFIEPAAEAVQPGSVSARS